MVNSLERVLLSPPCVTEDDIAEAVRVMRSGWLAPAGPDLKDFECAVSQFLGVPYAVATSSGTAALHLGLKYLGVQPGDRVILPTLTFAATAFAVTYLGATPVFVDVDVSWNMDPALLDDAIRDQRKSGHRVSAAIAVDLYGTPPDYESILRVLQDAQVPLLEDAAEGLGGVHERGPLGSFGSASVLSFNGNKIITTSGGGMLVTRDAEMADRVRYWATQAREQVPWYEHAEIGYNYRMSNLLAAIGNSQFRRLASEVDRRRWVRDAYRRAFSAIPDIAVQEDPSWGRSNAWLSVMTVVGRQDGFLPEALRQQLDNVGIEARPAWKPLHQQPVFRDSPAYLSGKSDELFATSLCLPSGFQTDQCVIERVAREFTHAWEEHV